MSSRAAPILIDFDLDDSEVEIVPHSRGISSSRANKRPKTGSQNKTRECIDLLSDEDKDEEKPRRLTKTPITYSSTARTLKTHTVAAPSTFDIKQTTVKPLHRTQAELSDSSEDELSDDTYTVAAVLQEYPTLNEFDVYERLAKGETRILDDIYLTVIRPHIGKRANEEKERLIKEIEKLSVKQNPPPNNPPKSISQCPRWRGPSLFADSTTKKHPPSFLSTSRGYPMKLHKTSGRPVIPDGFLDWTYLRLVERFQVAPGAINQISQSGKFVGIASVTFDGHNDQPPNHHNRGPSLMFWKDGSGATPIDNHSRHFVNDKPVENHTIDENQQGNLKHYNVNDVKFDPQDSTRAVSCGSDKRMFIWDLDGNDETLLNVRKVGQVKFRADLQEIHYRSDSAFAVLDATGSIYIYKSNDIEATTPLHIAAPGKNHVGLIAWGEEATYNYIFATWQSSFDGKAPNVMCHRAYDVRSGKFAFRISESPQSGNSIAIGPDGRYIALSMQGSEPQIDLHDVRLRCSKRISTITISGLQTPDADIEHMRFDPYGDYIAIGRTDNVVQVLDVRTNKIIEEFYHGRSISGPGAETFGITGLRWVSGWQGIGLRLFSGGDDGNVFSCIGCRQNWSQLFVFAILGCVRMWDIRSNARDYRNAELRPFAYGFDPLNGIGVAQERYPVGHFAIGKTGIHDNQEMALVVGDQGGQVSVYDRKGSYPF